MEKNGGVKILAAACLLAGAAALAAAQPRRLTLSSSAFDAGQKVPVLFTCDGENVSPPLAWEGVPERTKSMAITLDDPDAPAGDWVHWVLYDVPPAPPRRTTAIGAGKEGKSWGTDDSLSRRGYQGPCPPPGKPHHYVFTIYAVSRMTGLPAGVTRKELLQAIDGATLSSATLTGLYGR